MRGNDADTTLLTELYASVTDDDGYVALGIGRLIIDDQLLLYIANDLTTWNKYVVTADITNHGNIWMTVPVTYMESGTSGFAPGNNTNISLVLPVRGASGGGSYRFTQSTALADWTIPHTLGYRPAVVIENTAGEVIEGDVTYPDVDTVAVHFSVPLAGYANLS